MEFTLKKWNANYLSDFMEAMKDPNLSDKMCEELPYPMDSAYAGEYIRDRMLNSEESQICRAVVCDDKVVGGIDVIFGEGVFEKNGELSVWLAKEYRGKGLGSEVISEICRICFEEYDIIRIEARPYTMHNEAITALTNSGFRNEGTIHSGIFKNGKMYDYEIFAVIKDDFFKHK